jgi:hypothetical protein
MKVLLSAAVALAALGSATPALADVPLPGTGLTLNGEAEIMSDFRFRGISRSDEDPALQGNATLNHDSGFYVGTRATTLSGLDNFRLRDPELDDLGDIQFDLYAGYSRDLGGGLTVDGGLMYYVFAGAARMVWVTAPLSTTWVFGSPATERAPSAARSRRLLVQHLLLGRAARGGPPNRAWSAWVRLSVAVGEARPGAAASARNRAGRPAARCARRRIRPAGRGRAMPPPPQPASEAAPRGESQSRYACSIPSEGFPCRASAARGPAAAGRRW